MPVADKYTVDFLENETYHVYNRTNNKEKLFLSSDNYLFFLKKYDHYLSPYCQTYAWCLLPNHFHLLIRIKSSDEINRLLTRMDFNQVTETDRKFMKGEITVAELIEHAFKRFFQSYALAFNKVNNRKGNLFYQSFRRILVEKDSQFTSNITYIHLNPVKHGLTDDFTKWKWSSFQSIISGSPTKLLRQEILEWFAGRDQFIKLHQEQTGLYDNSDISIED